MNGEVDRDLSNSDVSPPGDVTSPDGEHPSEHPSEDCDNEYGNFDDQKSWWQWFLQDAQSPEGSTPPVCRDINVPVDVGASAESKYEHGIDPDHSDDYEIDENQFTDLLENEVTDLLTSEGYRFFFCF